MSARRTNTIVVTIGAAALALIGTTVAVAGPSAPNTVPSRGGGGPSAAVASGDRFAVMNADGSLARWKGAFFSQRLATGQYEVLFNRNVAGCAYIATIGSSADAGIETTGEVTTVRRAGTNNGVFLTTTDSAGRFSDRGVHLMVACR